MEELEIDDTESTVQSTSNVAAAPALDYDRIEVPYPFADGVNVYRVGDTLVDTGHMSWLDPVETALRDGALAGVERVVLTHPHSDHLGGSTTIPELADLPHIVYEGAPSVLNDVEGYFLDLRAEARSFSAGLPTPTEQQEAMQDLFFPLDEPYTEVNVERTVSDGDTVRVGAYDCEVLHTPGHSAHHMSLLHRESRTLFSGDIVSQNGHWMFGPLYWNLADYEDSLERLQGLTSVVDRFLPGHGPVMTEPDARVEAALSEFRSTRDVLRDAIHERGATTARELTEEALGVSGEAVPPLTMVTAVYLHHLADRGACRVALEPDGVYVTA